MRPEQIQKGLAQNKAFQEYQSLSREQKNKLKKSALEAKDLSQIENKDEQIFALQEIVRTNLEVIADFKRQLDGAKQVFKDISAEILSINDQRFDNAETQAAELARTILSITKSLTDFAGTTQSYDAMHREQ